MATADRTLTVWCFADARGATRAWDALAKNVPDLPRRLREHVRIVQAGKDTEPTWTYGQGGAARASDDARSLLRRGASTIATVLGQGVDRPFRKSLSDAFVAAGVPEEVEELVVAHLMVDSSVLLLVTDGEGPGVGAVAHARPVSTATRSGRATRKVSLRDGFAAVAGIDSYRGT